MRISDWSSDVCSSDLDAANQHENCGSNAGTAGGHAVVAVHEARQPGHQRTGDKQLQRTADVREDDGASFEQPGRQFAKINAGTTRRELRVRGDRKSVV